MISKFGTLENVTNKFLRTSDFSMTPLMSPLMSPHAQPLAPLKAMMMPEMMMNPLGQPKENVLVRGLDFSPLHANLTPMKNVSPRTISEKIKLTEKRRYPSTTKKYLVVDQPNKLLVDKIQSRHGSVASRGGESTALAGSVHTDDGFMHISIPPLPKNGEKYELPKTKTKTRKASAIRKGGNSQIQSRY